MNNKTILVTGGAGFIGGFMVRRLVEKEYNVLAIDNLSRNEEQKLPDGVEFIKGDIGDSDLLNSIFQRRSIDGVIHFAAFISMGESMREPFEYFKNNTFQTLNLLQSLKEHNIKNIIFSSTAGVYGNPTYVPIPEDHEKKPTNPYGESKLMSERLLEWYNKIFGFSYVSLRYFNACGASLDGEYGERHKPETHLIPNIIRSVLEDKEFVLHGTDYQTPDGTCVRDYIHVLDLVDAHILAIEKIMTAPGGYTYNVGTGMGLSNREIISIVEKVSGRKVRVVEGERRAGDANELIADVSKIKSELGFSPQFSDIHTIIESAWKWHSKS